VLCWEGVGVVEGGKGREEEEEGVEGEISNINHSQTPPLSPPF